MNEMQNKLFIIACKFQKSLQSAAAEMTAYYETKSQPITRVMVWQAYKEVKSNAGSGGIA